MALKVAIIQSENRQREIARRAGIPECDLSFIVTGRREATDDEKRALAKTLHRPIHELFPESPAVSA